MFSYKLKNPCNYSTKSFNLDYTPKFLCCINSYNAKFPSFNNVFFNFNFWSLRKQRSL